MTGLFRVTYFDPRGGHTNMEAFQVNARSAEEAIRKTNYMRSVKRYRAERVECLGWADNE